MKLEILKENLKKAITICEKITKKTTSLPVLQNVLLKTEGNFLELTTTNLETTVKWWILAKIEKEGKVVVPATFLANLISLIPAPKIQLSEENKNLILTTETQKTQIQGQDPEEFPIIPKIEKEILYQVSIEKLARGLNQVVDIPSPSQVRPEISGIYFSFKKDKLKIVGTDSFRLGEKTLELESQPQKDGSFILPQEAGRELLNILTQQQGKVNIYFNPNQVLFEFLIEETSHPQINLLSRLIEGEYPNYQEIIPKKYTTKIQIDKELFQNQIKEAGLFSGKILEVKLTPLPKENKIKIFSQSPDTGQNESYLPAKIEGEKIEVSFNYRFLLDGLNSIKSSEVIFELSGEEGPGVLRPVGDLSYIYILMPIKAS
jgi:DNA polymerase-3 subunit beta